MKIVEFDKRAHLTGVRRCLIELQDFERTFNPRMPTGDEIADEYMPEMLQRCKDCDGKILVADVNGQVAGYATVLTRIVSDEIEDGGLEYGLVSDLIVDKDHRRQGVGQQLLGAAEAYAKERGTKWLRVGVLASNQIALEVYQNNGFSALYVELEKDLGRREQ